MDRKHEDILPALGTLAQTINRWRQRIDAPTVTFQGATVQIFDHDVGVAMSKLFRVSRTDQWDLSAQELILAIDEFERLAVEWCDQIERRRPVNPSGSYAMWAALELAIDRHSKPRLFLPPESVATLAAQNVSHSNIAKIYGWRTFNGTPDIHKVTEELQKPGTHFDVDTWVHPDLPKYQDEMTQRWASHHGHNNRPGWHDLYGRQLDDEPHHEPPKRVDAPETLEELIVQGVGEQQILKMKPGVSLEDIRVTKHALGLGPPQANSATATLEQDQANAVALARNSHPDLETVEDRIVAMSHDGWEPREIFETMQLHFPELSRQKMTAVLAKAKKADEANEGNDE